MPAAEGRRRSQREALYWHYPHYGNQGGKPGGAVRAGDYKLIEFYEDGRRELFDLTKDIGESDDLVERDPRRAGNCTAKLEAWRKEVGAKMPEPNPQYDPATASEGLTGWNPPPAAKR